MWRILNESVEGAAHRQAGIECQDASAASVHAANGRDVLVLACSDGAGSASQSAAGARVACQAAVKRAMQFLETGHPASELTDSVVRQWIAGVHCEVAAEARRRHTVPRELQCTLLLCVIGHSSSAFAQIGDGAIVVRATSAYRPVFWPQHGEYRDTTFFVTDDDYARQLEVSLKSKRINEVAVFTDGLQTLALNYRSKTVHGPFFKPMFEFLRTAPDPRELALPLRQFLDSPKVNERTNDDKTLVLAARVPRVDATV